MNILNTELLIIAPILMLIFALVWFYSFKKQVFAWIDFIWALSFSIVIIIHQGIKYYQSASISLSIIEVLYLVWSARLSLHLFRRISKHGEDKRYIKLKKEWKVWYGVKFFLLFQAEVILTLVLSIPIFLNYPSHYSIFTLLSVFVFSIAMIGETSADNQLKRFIHETSTRSKVCNVGLWKYSRHPNYFFEWLIWVAFALYSFSSQQKWPGLIPPIVMFYFLTKVSGIPPAEASSLKSKKENYRKYQSSTNAFFPWFPKVAIGILLGLSLSLPTQTIFAAGVMSMNQQEKIKYVFNALRVDNMEILEDFYAKEAKFIDPIGEHLGLDKIKGYYQGLYKNVKEIKFEPIDVVSQGNNHVFIWKMTLQSDGLNNGRPVTLEGNSHLVFNDNNLVIYHRDYFDMGEFIYEHIPVLGWALRKIKTKLGGVR